MSLPTFTDGRRFTMRMACAWCGRELGRVECIAAQADKVSHGICPVCLEREMATLPGPARPTLNEAAAAQTVSTPSGSPRPLQGKGTAAGGTEVPEASDHPSGGPVASFTPSGGIWAWVDRWIKRLSHGRRV